MPVVQNKNQAQTMAVIDLTLAREGTGWRVVDRASQSVRIADYEADPALLALLEDADRRAREDAMQVIGQLEGEPLAPESGADNIPAARIQDTALADLINTVQLYYANAQVSAAALPMPEANLYPGEIRKCDISKVYKVSDALYKLRMTGGQLKALMEWCADFYNTCRPGDTVVTFNESFPPYNYCLFAGVCYEVNISREPGSRIEHLTWPDGTPVSDADAFDLVANSFFASAQLLTPGIIFEEDDLPTLLEKDVHGEIGGIRELIRDYIVTVKGGRIAPECDENWRLTGLVALDEAT